MKWLAAVSLIVGLLLAGCAAPKPAETAKSEAAKQYPMRGSVTALDADARKAVIDHEEIKDFMPAMTMPYPVKDPAEFSKLAVGDKITATVYVTEDNMWIANIKKAEPAH